MAPREPELQFTLCFLFVHSVVHPGLHVIAWSRAGIHLTSIGPSGSYTVIQQRDLCSVFITVGMRTHSGIISSSEQTLLPQLLSAVTFEFQRLTEDSPTVDPSDGLRHGNVRIGVPREPVLRFSSRLLLVRNPDYTGISLLGVELGFRRDRRGSTQVLQVYFAAVRDSLDVAAPGDCSSAIKPKMEHRPIFLMLGIDSGP